jgi:hypothetical protein
MTTPTKPPRPDPELVIHALLDAAIKARMDLQAWMKNYGSDIGTEILVAELDSAIRKARL